LIIIYFSISHTHKKKAKINFQIKNNKKGKKYIYVGSEAVYIAPEQDPGIFNSSYKKIVNKIK